MDAGALPGFLELAPGGIKAVVAAERAERRPARSGGDPTEQAKAELRCRPVLAEIAMPGDAEFVVLRARREGGMLQIVAEVETLVDQAVRKAAG